MTVIGVTSRCRRGYVALYRGYVAVFRGYVAHRAHNPLFPLSFPAYFRPLPSFYLLSTNGILWTRHWAWPDPLASWGTQQQSQAVRPKGGRRSPRRSRVPVRLSLGATARADAEPLNNRPMLTGRGIVGDPLSQLGQAASRRVSPEGRGRGEPVGGCGTPAEEPALSTPLRGGQRSRPRAGAEIARRHANQWGVDRSPTLWRTLHTLTPMAPARRPSAPEHPDFHNTGIMSDPCPRLVSDKGGLADFGCQFRHAQTWRIGAQNQPAPHPSGVGMHRIPGVVLSRLLTTQKSIQQTADEPSDTDPKTETIQMGKAKKFVLKLLPPDWREAMFDRASQPDWRQSRPQLLPALALLWVIGCRPKEIDQGIRVSYQNGQLLIAVEGAKCNEERGIPLRGYKFRTRLDTTGTEHPALAALREYAEQNARDRGALVKHSADYLYNSVVALGKAVFPRLRTRLSPYCFRHQIASDLKADPDVPLEDAAKFMGHLSDYSIGKYGHAIHGKKGGERIKPLAIRTSRPVKHSPKVDKLARFKIASANRRNMEPS